MEVAGGAENLWRRKAVNKLDYEEARDGDHLITPFQCDLCIFRCIKYQNPDPDSQADQDFLAYIRRINLDAFWSRARGTVKGNKNIIERTIKEFSTYKLCGPFYDKGPTPDFDHAGYETAIALLMDTRRKGKHDSSHKQWDSSRKVKSAIANFEKATSHNLINNLALIEDDRGSTS